MLDPELDTAGMARAQGAEWFRHTVTVGNWSKPSAGR